MRPPLGVSDNDRIVFNPTTQIWERGGANQLSSQLIHMFANVSAGFTEVRYLAFSGDAIGTNSLPSAQAEMVPDADGSLVSAYFMSGQLATAEVNFQLWVDGSAVGTVVNVEASANPTPTRIVFPDAVFSAGQRVAVAIDPVDTIDRDFSFTGLWSFS